MRKRKENGEKRKRKKYVHITESSIIFVIEIIFLIFSE
jgi:hypothetical protein